MAEIAAPPADDFDDPTGETPGQQPPVAFDAWLTDQPDDVKTLIGTHTTGLKSALDSERTARRDLEKQVKRSELRTQLDRLSTDLSATSHRADFYDEAHKQGVKNLRLSFLAAKESGLIDDRGRCDFGKLKTDFPELFSEIRKSAPSGAGTGAGTQPAAPQTMNDIIRRKAGVR